MKCRITSSPDFADPSSTYEWALHWKAALAKSDVSPREATRAVIRYIQKHCPTLYSELERLTAETTFDIRGYGGGHFYVWSYHPLLGPHDPWPASHFPKTEVAWDHLLSRCTRLAYLAFDPSI